MIYRQNKYDEKVGLYAGAVPLLLCITLFAMGDQRGSRHHRPLQESAPSTVAVEAPKLLRHLKTDHLEAFKFHFENADAARKYSASASGMFTWFDSNIFD